MHHLFQTATVNWNNGRNGYTTLNTNPFETAPNSNKIRVTQRNHGFIANDKVTIANVADGFYGANSTSAIPASELNGQHTVVAPVTADTYIIEITGANVTLVYLDYLQTKLVVQNVLATRNVLTDIVQPSITNIRFADTSLTYDMNIVARQC